MKKAIEYRLESLRKGLTIRDKLPESIVEDFEIRIDELETLLDIIQKKYPEVKNDIK